MTADPVRCAWAGSDPLMVEYHDVEWGVPQHDRVRLFEKVSLEGAQAGLSWRTILNKREGYRACFAGFDPAKVARFSEAKVDTLVADARIVRNRAKVASVVTNAQALLRLEREVGDFGDYLWSFVDGVPIQNRWTDLGDLPAQTDVSEALSQGPQAARIPIRRSHHDVRAHASDGHGQRPCRDLLPARRTGLIEASDAGWDCGGDGGGKIRLGLEGFENDLGDVGDDNILVALALHAVVHHHVTERARDGDALGPGRQRFLRSFGVDLLADGLFHPHARAAGATAHALGAVARHLDDVDPGE